jgi:hypothetical protein
MQNLKQRICHWQPSNVAIAILRHNLHTCTVDPLILCTCAGTLHHTALHYNARLPYTALCYAILPHTHTLHFTTELVNYHSGHPCTLLQYIHFKYAHPCPPLQYTTSLPNTSTLHYTALPYTITLQYTTLHLTALGARPHGGFFVLHSNALDGRALG